MCLQNLKDVNQCSLGHQTGILIKILAQLLLWLDLI